MDAGFLRLPAEPLVQELQQIEGDVDAATLELRRLFAQLVENVVRVTDAIHRVFIGELLQTVGETNRLDLAHGVHDAGIVRAQSVHAREVLLAHDGNENGFRICSFQFREQRIEMNPALVARQTEDSVELVDDEDRLSRQQFFERHLVAVDGERVRRRLRALAVRDRIPLRDCGRTKRRDQPTREQNRLAARLRARQNDDSCFV